MSTRTPRIKRDAGYDECIQLVDEKARIARVLTMLFLGGIVSEEILQEYL